VSVIYNAFFAKMPYNSAKEPYNSAKMPYDSAKTLYNLAKVRYLSVKRNNKVTNKTTINVRGTHKTKQNTGVMYHAFRTAYYMDEITFDHTEELIRRGYLGAAPLSKSEL